MTDTPSVSQLLEQPVERAAREVALRMLEKAEAERPRLADPADEEGLHDFRVAVRRLRSWLRAFKGPLRGSVKEKHRRKLRGVAHATNEGRDAEVHVSWLRGRPELLRGRRARGTEWLIDRLQSQGEAAGQALGAKVEKSFVPLRRTLARRLEVYQQPVRPAGGGTTFAAALAGLVQEMADELREKLAAVGEPGDEEAGHTARIAAKHLRYLLEPVAAEVEGAEAVVGRLKELQDVLGGLHDAHVFGAEVTAAMVVAAGEHARELSRTVLRGRKSRATIRRARHDPFRSGLLAVAQRLRANVDACFEAFAAAWRGAAAEGFWREVGKAVESLGALGGRDREIERKYLLSSLPGKARSRKAVEITQGYLAGKRLVERLRRVSNGRTARFYRTVKLGAGVSRTEIEEETTRAVFDRMWPLTRGRRLTKRRRRVKDGGLVWEIDEFTDRTLFLAEVELPAEDAEVAIPGWLQPHLVREVTEEADYLNLRLAR